VRSSSADARKPASQDNGCLLPACIRRALLAQRWRRLSIKFGRSAMTNPNCPFRPLEAVYRNSYARRSVALLPVLGASVSIPVRSPNICDENLNCALGNTVSRQLRSWICGAAAVRVATVHPEQSPTQSLNASNVSLHQTHQPGFAPSPSGGDVLQPP